MSQGFSILDTLKPGQGLADLSKTIAKRLVSNEFLFPKDITNVVALPPVSLVGSNHSMNGETAKPFEYLSFVRFKRRIKDMPIFGPGTKAMIAVAGDNSIHAFAHRWRKAKVTSMEVKPLPRLDIAKLIIAQSLQVPKMQM